MHRPVDDMFHSTSSSRDSRYDPAFNGGRQDLATTLTEIFAEGWAQLDPHKKRALINMVEGSNHASEESAEQPLEQADFREGKGSEQSMGEGTPSKRAKEEYCSPKEGEPRLTKTSLTLDEDKYNQLRMYSLVERVPLREIFDIAMDMYIDEFVDDSYSWGGHSTGE